MKITSPSRQALAHLTSDEEAVFRCETALGFKDQADAEAALKAIRPFWRMGERPKLDGLAPSVAAELLLTAGILTGWIGGRTNTKETQEEAKNLITESITYYESVGDEKRIAAARSEIAFCYWRAGQLDEARILLRQALDELPPQGTTRARAILKLVTIESTALRFEVSSGILEESTAVFENISNDTVVGSYHNEIAIVHRNFAKSEPLRRDQHLQKALRESEIADHHFTLGRNNVYRCVVKNNVGLILFNLSRYKEAHKYLTRSAKAHCQSQRQGARGSNR